MRMRTKTMVVAALMLTVASGALTPLVQAGGTPDGETPAQEMICDEAGLERSAWGLCVAFCEASDCDTFPKRPSCTGLRRNFTRLTGMDRLPCEDQGPVD